MLICGVIKIVVKGMMKNKRTKNRSHPEKKRKESAKNMLYLSCEDYDHSKPSDQEFCCQIVNIEFEV